MHQAIQSLAQQITSTVPQAGPHWTAYVTALALPVIALIGAWIAFRQWQIARNKLKLDLYDKRMAVYDVVRKTLGVATGHGKLTQDNEIEFLSGVRTAQWLFGPEVSTYLEETLWHKIIAFNLHNTMSSGPASDERTKHIHARAETLNWLSDQYKEFDRLCSPYLQLRH
jgi:hypothetical protein